MDSGKSCQYWTPTQFNIFPGGAYCRSGFIVVLPIVKKTSLEGRSCEILQWSNCLALLKYMSLLPHPAHVSMRRSSGGLFPMGQVLCPIGKHHFFSLMLTRECTGAVDLFCNRSSLLLHCKIPPSLPLVVVRGWTVQLAPDCPMYFWGVGVDLYKTVTFKLKKGWVWAVLNLLYHLERLHKNNSRESQKCGSDAARDMQAALPPVQMLTKRYIIASAGWGKEGKLMHNHVSQRHVFSKLEIALLTFLTSVL